MSQLLTQCPFCQTTFKVSDAQLQVASGVVRCGSCMEVFLATQHRVILKDKPSPLSRQQPATGYSADFPESPTHVDSDDDYAEPFNRSSEPGWQVVEEDQALESEDIDAEEDDEDDDFDINEPALGDGLVEETDEDIDELQAQHTESAVPDNAFSSWEAEEAFHAVNDPVETDNEDSDTTPEPDEPNDRDTDPDSDDEESEPEPEPSPYGGMLNPTGYAMTSFSVDHVLPKTSAIDEALENDPAMWGEQDEWDDTDERDEPDGSDDDERHFLEEVSAESGDLEPDTIAEGEQFPVQPAAVRTAVIVPEKSGSIPTLVPDVVASEAIPAEGLGAQTMAWFQSFRKSFRDKTGQDEDYSGTDEKAEIRSHLSGLRHEDSLDPVASEALDVFDNTPVELPYNLQQWPGLKTAGMIAASALLLLGLGLQYAWFNLDTLVLERRMAGVTGLLCGITECPDTELIDLSTLVTEELVVRSHPSVEDALQVNFIFRNDRNREQPFPLVELNFTNIDGEVIANRVFTSEEYMPGEMQLFTHMPAHSSIQVSLDLVDPGSAATGYSLVFRNP